MPSEKQLAANQRNALKSTGPRSRAGKMRASKNSLRHGLAAGQVPSHVRDQVERIARDLLQNDDGLAAADAREIAKSEVILRAVRKAKTALLDQIWDVSAPAMVDRQGRKWGENPRLQQGTTDKIGAALAKIERLNRYEQEARVRRNRALGSTSERI